MRYDDAMTKYIDLDGREWDSAKAALDNFVDELPSLNEEQYEALCQHTLHTESAGFNLRAFSRAINEDPELTELFIGYPVPKPLLNHGPIPDFATPPFSGTLFSLSCKCGMTFSTQLALDDHIVDNNAADLAGEEDPMRDITPPTNWSPL